MQLNSIIKLILPPAILAGSITSTFAAGIGITLGSGTESWDSGTIESDNTNAFEHHDGDRKISNFGFVVDTTIAKNRLFNYRFSLVTEENKADVNGYNIDLKGISMIHDFGFGIVRNRAVRLWVGPELKAAFYDEVTPSFASSQTFDGGVWGFGVGPAIGLNIHLPRVVSFSVSGAYYVLSHYYGNYDSTGFYSSSVDVSDSSRGLFFNASILFRFNDYF